MTSPTLLAVLERARALGFLGPGPIEPHLQNGAAFIEALVGVGGLVVDLGSGGGLPALVVAESRPDLRLVLVEALAKRCRFLEWAIDEVCVTDRAQVVEARAEDVGRGLLRGSAAAVTARSFGPPAATAECAAPLLHLGGRLLVSEPPQGSDRWPRAGLARLGMAPAAVIEAHGAHIQIIEQTDPCPDRYPRRVGIPAKRLLF